MTVAVDEQVLAVLEGMPLSRLTHFTPARNLPHILRDRELRSVVDLEQSVRDCYTPTDRARLDGHPDKICCSLQYPNAFYFDYARRSEHALNYPGWACLLIDKRVAALTGTLFCPRNAAAAAARCEPGAAALRRCYAEAVTGQGGVTRRRGPAHDPASPTDVQAEVLVTAPIPLAQVRGIVFPTDAEAREEYGRLDRFGLWGAAPPFLVSPGLFSKGVVSAAVTRSAYFEETVWPPPSNDA